ncbi:fibronectin type III domain-containing protein [Dyadobacter sandarakinus]|uniref:Fibronectin type III domain-containing protein n=1 Tax=Dyadobacter sandarakinus TaxID=2747268 RepID=A0ABX7I0T2_9BACT|nr:fibronectin type III domain-containing protein [Dyadobacter sandarakinus]QRQ99650.1 fibronectin type III domain-containing protein [Dyadobacter sandarakinus]
MILNYKRLLSPAFACLLLGMLCTAAMAAVPKPPADLKATAVSPSQITLTWTDASADETAFELEQSADGKTFVKLAEVAVNVVTYQHTGLKASTAYWYRIRSKNASGASAYSAIANATTQPPLITIPKAPDVLTATAASGTRINLAWSDNASDETGFELERSLNGTNFIKIADLPANTEAFADTGLVPVTRYWYRILAKNTAGKSAYSNIASAATLQVVPAAPTGLQANATSSSQINLTWRDNAGNETGYEVERSPDGNTFTRVGTLPPNAASFGSLGLTPDTRYYYRVRAVNAVGVSPYSNVAAATTQRIPVPAQPERLTAVPLAPALIQLRWAPVSGGPSQIVVERSKGLDENYAAIANLPGNATSYEDKDSLEVDDYQYRIKATNAGGDSPYSLLAIVRASSIITGEVLPAGAEVYVADGRQLVVKLMQVQPAQLRIYDPTGRRVVKRTFSSPAYISLDWLPAGIYIVVVEAGQMVFTRRIFVY